MNLNRILCPIDYSKHSQSANIYASMMASASDAEIVYVLVVYPPVLDSSIEGELKAMLLELESKVKPYIRGVKCRYEIGYGDPAKEIVKVAEDLNADLIVLGTHGRTGASRLLHGSVCEKVLRLAKCPVMAVKRSLGNPEVEEVEVERKQPNHP